MKFSRRCGQHGGARGDSEPPRGCACRARGRYGAALAELCIISRREGFSKTEKRKCKCLPLFLFFGRVAAHSRSLHSLQQLHAAGSVTGRCGPAVCAQPMQSLENNKHRLTRAGHVRYCLHAVIQELTDVPELCAWPEKDTRRELVQGSCTAAQIR